MTTRPSVLFCAFVVCAGALAPVAPAADTLTVLSLTPSSGPVQIVPGGENATPAALNPSNRIIARVVFPNAASYEKVNFMSVSATSVPAVAPPGQNAPRLVVKPFQKTPVSGRGPIRVDVEFGYACYHNNIHQMTLTSVQIIGYDQPGLPPGFTIAGKILSNLVVTCPLPVPKSPPVSPKKL